MVNVTESYSPKQFLLEALSNYETFALLTAGFSTFDRFIHKFIVELHAMQCLFVSGSKKQKRRGRVGLFQTSHKDRLFHLLWQPSAFGGNLTMQTPILQPQEENIPGHSTERRTLTDMLIFRHYDNSVWYKENNFSQQIQFFKNHWRSVSNKLRLFIIKPFHTLIIKI